MHSCKALPGLICLLFSASLFAADGTLSAEDVLKIKQVHRQYEQTWLKGDDNGLRAFFTEDSFLLPPHRGTARIGRAGMDAFWFPPGAPPTKVTKLELVIKDI